MPGGRKPDIRRVRISRTYSVLEIASLLDVHPNTVRRWINSGLKPMDGGTPLLVHGSELRRFLSERNSKRKQACRPDEMPCFRCRASRKPVPGSVAIASRNEKTIRLRGVCAVCGACMLRAGSVARLAEYAATFGTISAGSPRLEGQGFPLVDGDFKEDDGDDQIQPEE